MYKSSLIHRISKVLVDIMFYGGILCCIAVPFAVPVLTRYWGYAEGAVIPFIIILVSSGLCAVYILRQLKAMFKTLVGGNPFITANVTCLRKCAVVSFCISMIYVVKIVFWITMGSVLIVIIFALLGLFCLTLKDLFKQAVAYKEENDWTV